MEGKKLSFSVVVDLLSSAKLGGAWSQMSVCCRSCSVGEAVRSRDVNAFTKEVQNAADLLFDFAISYQVASITASGFS